MERSVFSDRMVFVRAVRESGWMGDVELAVYDSWFGPILETNPSLKPDGFIYLKCDPSTCMERWVVFAGERAAVDSPAYLRQGLIHQ
jgi:deoxyadenosine/deoxycytidine kinase